MPRPVASSRLRGLALALGILACWPHAWAQQPTATKERTLPSGTVLAINLVSAEEVRPTTGVLVSADGLVAVPLAFAEEGAELVVLDGGGNVLRHGRRATVLHRIKASGLAILQVEGLRGTPLELAETPGVDAERLYFGAFPPAEQMAAGVGPMWLGVTLVANPEAGVYGLEGEQPIPNVSGPLFNRCQHWVGYSLATGEPALKSDFGPIVLFSPELRRAMSSAGVSMQTGYCPPLPVNKTASTDAPIENTADVAPPTVEPGEADEPPPEDTADVIDNLADENIGGAAQPAAAADTGNSPEQTAVPVDDAGGRAITAGWWLPALALMTAGAWWWARRRRTDTGGGPAQAAANNQPRHAAEPGAELFENVPDRRQLPPGYSGWWQLSGESRDGYPLRLHLPFGAGHTGAVVALRDDGVRLFTGQADSGGAEAANTKGTGRGATLAADQPGPALGLEPGTVGVVISVLDSRLPCRVAGVSCLAGEKVYANADDVIMLDGHRFSIRIMETAPS